MTVIDPDEVTAKTAGAQRRQAAAGRATRPKHRPPGKGWNRILPGGLTSVSAVTSKEIGEGFTAMAEHRPPGI